MNIYMRPIEQYYIISILEYWAKQSRHYQQNLIRGQKEETFHTLCSYVLFNISPHNMEQSQPLKDKTIINPRK